MEFPQEWIVQPKYLWLLTTKVTVHWLIFLQTFIFFDTFPQNTLEISAWTNASIAFCTQLMSRALCVIFALLSKFRRFQFINGFPVAFWWTCTGLIWKSCVWKFLSNISQSQRITENMTSQWQSVTSCRQPGREVTHYGTKQRLVATATPGCCGNEAHRRPEINRTEVSAFFSLLLAAFDLELDQMHISYICRNVTVRKRTTKGQNTTTRI